MSEYQYYEFAAVDEPLTDKQMEELRAISTRAETTPTSFISEYHRGDFANANIARAKLLKRYRSMHATTSTASQKSSPRTAAQLRAAGGIE